MRMILLGIQGCGKGTQADLLEKEFGWKHVNVGDLFRRHSENNTLLGQKARNYMEKGELVPDKLVFEVVLQELHNAKKGFILDGFPRNLEQMKFLLEKFTIDHVFLLDLDKNVAVKRISSRRHCQDCKLVYNLISRKPKKDGICDACGGKLVQRDDDVEEAVARRIEKFYQETGKVIDHFREQGNLIIINADDTLASIYSKIREYLS
ncbi:MAG: nucleoside monophosphate kinase [Candidatus Cloacimonetes bacterium]|nr:nucleoside monophosphate kinase [Candidatus Cloacimonadota bacterium]